MTRFLKSVRRYKVYLVLAAIFLFAGFVRFYNISEVPVSLYWDEVSQVYSAYSILETGKDEYGNSFPLLFRAFEDYKTPANIYLTAISVKLFGLNEFSARFSSAFLGTLSIFFVFLFIEHDIETSDEMIRLARRAPKRTNFFPRVLSIPGIYRFSKTSRIIGRLY